MSATSSGGRKRIQKRRSVSGSRMRMSSWSLGVRLKKKPSIWARPRTLKPSKRSSALRRYQVSRRSSTGTFPVFLKTAGVISDGFYQKWRGMRTEIGRRLLSTCVGEAPVEAVKGKVQGELSRKGVADIADGFADGHNGFHIIGR